MSRDIFLIDNFRRANCHTLMVVSNLYWNEAAYGQSCLDDRKILDLISQIKARARSILDICQNRQGYIPWVPVRHGRKRMNCQAKAEQKECKRVKWSS